MIMKMSALFLFQLLKLKKMKCLYFLDQTPFKGDISSFLSFDFMKMPENPLTSHKMSKSPYLTQMMSDQKNNCRFLSSTFKVEWNNDHFSYNHFVVS